METPDQRCPCCFEVLLEDLTCADPSCPIDAAERSLSDLPLGTILNAQYVIGRVLGRGGFGITYLAWDERLERRRAVKECYPHGLVRRGRDQTSVLPINEEKRRQLAYVLDKFLREARVLAHFHDHPNIVSVLSILDTNGSAYLVMEYLSGHTFKTYLEQQPDQRIGWEEALTILTPIVEALTAVHAQNWLHRDISPDNIFLTDRGQVKLLDFGAARQAAGQHSKSLAVVLKEGYAPVEQYSAKGQQGSWTDVYGLAATLHRAITGETPPAALDRYEDDELQVPSAFGVDVPPHVEGALFRALALKAPDRTQTVQAFASDLLVGTEGPRSQQWSGVAGVTGNPTTGRVHLEEKREAEPWGAGDHAGGERTGVSPQVSTLPPDTAVPRSTQRRTGFLIGMAAGVVLLMGLVAWGPTESSQSPPVDPPPQSASPGQQPASTPNGQPGLVPAANDGPAGPVAVWRTQARTALARGEDKVALNALSEALRGNRADAESLAMLRNMEAQAASDMHRVRNEAVELDAPRLATRPFRSGDASAANARSLSNDTTLDQAVPLLWEARRYFAAAVTDARARRAAERAESEKLAELDRQRVEAERQATLAEAERLRLEAARQQAAEAEKQRAAEAERLRIAGAERQRLAAEAAKVADAEKQRLAAEGAKVAEAERQRLAAEAAKVAEGERQKRAAADLGFLASVAGRWTRRAETGGSTSRQVTEDDLTINADGSGVLRRTVRTQSRGFAGWKDDDSDTTTFNFRYQGTGQVAGDVRGQVALDGAALQFAGAVFRRR